MVVLFLNCGMRLSELVGMDLGDIDLEQRQIRLFGKGHKERMVYLNEACIEALQLYLAKRNTMEGLNPKEKAVFVTRRRKAVSYTHLDVYKRQVHTLMAKDTEGEQKMDEYYQVVQDRKSVV